ncbi:presenilin family intramembrane aspartyl protease PSH [Natronorarus salvus]|uniref:presenilin family intramembrane aspartyl protease PSH n=1 Tax=Natronorarus salvus TaxID=3117733 RepID=UPI002F26833D
MDHRTRLALASAATLSLFVFVQLGALALVEPFQGAGLQPTEETDDPSLGIWYLLVILVATGGMLAAFRYGFDWVVRGAVILASVLLSWYVLLVVVPPVILIGDWNVLATLGALGVGFGLLVYPEWYVIDAAGVLMGAGAAGLFGITFGLLPALVLLVALAIYDAISVYGTKHMLSLADSVMDIKVPVLLIVPTTLSYSFLATEKPASLSGEAEADGGAEPDGHGDEEHGETDGDGPDAAENAEETVDPSRRDALFIGLGDAVIPTVLVASAAFFIPVGTLSVPGIAINLAALGAMVGTLCGLVVLLWMVLKGRAHAGLPLLNGGAIAGYVVGALASGLTLVQALGLGPYL